jgi:hypothetical protein
MTRSGVICVLFLLPIIGGIAWAMSAIVPWWGCVAFGLVGIIYSIGLLGDA